LTWGVNKSEKLGWTSPKSARTSVAAIFKMATTPVGQKNEIFQKLSCDTSFERKFNADS